ncbi:MAG TPA: MXAN_5187 C-terminal domain-containing protein [Blastocatellia bacterium]|nr:MXAN_5187 C-terminal domain-containing protein [Blastocatellia bacterium]
MEQKVVNPLDQELDRLEQEMRRLKVEYDIYFNGGTLRPPNDTKGRVETAIKRIYDARNMSFSQRFRYNSLVARYNVMRELWRRQTQGREESGKPPTAEAQAAARAQSVIIRFSNPEREPEKVSQLYDHLIAARRACGERLGNLSLDVFTKFMRSRAGQIKSRLGSESVDFLITVDNGEVRFTARAVDQTEAAGGEN